jgi:tryptophan synthase
MKNAPPGEVAQHVEAFCREITQKGKPTRVRSPPATRVKSPDQSAKRDPSARIGTALDTVVLPPRFGQFGGQYVPEALVDCLVELEQAHKSAMADPVFQKELHSHFGYINRPSQIYLAENLTKDAGGANIWLKREDLYVS